MPLVASDLKIYGSANMPENDTGTCGGAIDLTTRVVFDNTVLPNALNDKLAINSSLAEDTGTCTVTGRNAAKIITSENFTMTGVTQASGSTTFTDIMKIVYTDHHGTITVKDQTTQTSIIAFESGVNTIRKPFYDLQFTSAGKTAYDKIFLKNTHATDALQNAWIFETQDPSGVVQFGLASGASDGETMANRLTPPVWITASGFSSSEKDLLYSHIYAGSGVGIYLKTILNGTQHTFFSTYTLQASGTIVT